MNKIEVVVDTNVPRVANGEADHANWECVAASVQELRKIHAERRTLLDDKLLIFKEYLGNLRLSGQPGVGDAFFKWLWENQANEQHCRYVSIIRHPDRKFEEFPDDARLSSFDQSDRKFVAVAVASGSSPQVLNAVDRDWWDHRKALKENGVNVVFLCPELMQMER